MSMAPGERLRAPGCLQFYSKDTPCADPPCQTRQPARYNLWQAACALAVSPIYAIELQNHYARTDRA